MKKTHQEENDFSNVCLFVCSSDNTRDVFFQVCPSYQKFWPDLPFESYVGLNTPTVALPEDFHAVYAPVSSWKTELYLQIEALPERLQYILLLLDDFLIISRVDNRRVETVVQEVIMKKFSYLCLRPLHRAWLPSLGKRLTRKYSSEAVERIKKGRPYYSSLQAAIWERNHLLDMLRLDGDIWDFENQFIPRIDHYAVIRYPAIPYIHMVEKGRWVPNAETLFRAIGLPFESTRRAVRPKSDLVRSRINKLKFGLIGYQVVRLKRRLPILRSLSWGPMVRSWKK